MSIYCRCPDVLWHTVGVNHEETLLIKEGPKERDGTRMFIVSGKTGAAIWSRLDGIRSADHISNELAVARNMPLSSARVIVFEFLDVLKENSLIEKCISDTSAFHEIIAWPQTIDPPCLDHLDLESLVAEEMVALASLVGGQDNISGTAACQGSVGGKNNITGLQQPCHP